MGLQEGKSGGPPPRPPPRVSGSPQVPLQPGTAGEGGGVRKANGGGMLSFSRPGSGDGQGSK